MNLHLIDIDSTLVEAWRDSFSAWPNVDIQEGNILDYAHNTIVSPANSYGYMDGGIDRLYTEYFGLRPQDEVQKRIAARPDGHLPVGAALLVPTGHPGIPYLIAAPTMVSPGPVPACHSFFAMTAVLRTAADHSQIVTDVFCPGLATGTGRVPPMDAANEMSLAYRKWKKRNDQQQVELDNS